MTEFYSVVASGEGWFLSRDGQGRLQLTINREQFLVNPKQVTVTLPKGFIGELLQQKKAVVRAATEEEA